MDNLSGDSMTSRERKAAQYVEDKMCGSPIEEQVKFEDFLAGWDARDNSLIRRDVMIASLEREIAALRASPINHDEADRIARERVDGCPTCETGGTCSEHGEPRT